MHRRAEQFTLSSAPGGLRYHLWLFFILVIHGGRTWRRGHLGKMLAYPMSPFGGSCGDTIGITSVDTEEVYLQVSPEHGLGCTPLTPLTPLTPHHRITASLGDIEQGCW